MIFVNVAMRLSAFRYSRSPGRSTQRRQQNGKGRARGLVLGMVSLAYSAPCRSRSLDEDRSSETLGRKRTVLAHLIPNVSRRKYE